MSANFQLSKGQIIAALAALNAKLAAGEVTESSISPKARYFVEEIITEGGGIP